MIIVAIYGDLHHKLPQYSLHCSDLHYLVFTVTVNMLLRELQMSMLANPIYYDWLYLQEKQTCDIPATDSVVLAMVG